MHEGTPSVSGDNGYIALYLFDEKKGTFVYNRGSTNSHLMIPETFTPLRRIVLSSPQDDFRWNLSYFRDVTINIVGFIPFGFFCAAFLCRVKRLRISTIYLTVAIVGLGFSLAIELIQAYIPTRYSDLTDVICNILGTIMGLIIFHKAVFPFSAAAHE